MEQLTGRLWGKKEHGEFTHPYFSLTLCKNGNEPIIVPWTGPQWCLGSIRFLYLTCPYLLPISHHFCLSKMSRYHFFPQRFCLWCLPWSGMYFTAFCSHLVSPFWYLSQNSTVYVYELHEGKGYILFGLINSFYEESQFGHGYSCGKATTRLLCQTRNHSDVRKELQTGLPREEFLENQPCQTTGSWGFGQVSKSQDLFNVPYHC